MLLLLIIKQNSIKILEKLNYGTITNRRKHLRGCREWRVRHQEGNSVTQAWGWSCPRQGWIQHMRPLWRNLLLDVQDWRNETRWRRFWNNHCYWRRCLRDSSQQKDIIPYSRNLGSIQIPRCKECPLHSSARLSGFEVSSRLMDQPPHCNWSAWYHWGAWLKVLRCWCGRLSSQQDAH